MSRWVVVAFVSVCFAVVLSSCGGPPPDPKRVDVEPLRETSKRFKVSSQGYFRAGYNDHEREILVIEDTETGKTYLGVTGVGVTELWTETRRHGKTTSTVTVEE